MKEQKYHLYLSKEEYSRLIQSLIRLKNSLIAQYEKTACTLQAVFVLYSVIPANWKLSESIALVKISKQLTQFCRLSYLNIAQYSFYSFLIF